MTSDQATNTVRPMVLPLRRSSRAAFASASGRVFTATDLPRMQPIRIVTHAAGARATAWPPLATDKVRFVGEAIAACVAPSEQRGAPL